MSVCVKTHTDICIIFNLFFTSGAINWRNNYILKGYSPKGHSFTYQILRNDLAYTVICYRDRDSETTEVYLVGNFL